MSLSPETALLESQRPAFVLIEFELPLRRKVPQHEHDQTCNTLIVSVTRAAAWIPASTSGGVAGRPLATSLVACSLQSVHIQKFAMALVGWQLDGQPTTFSCFDSLAEYLQKCFTHTHTHETLCATRFVEG